MKLIARVIAVALLASACDSALQAQQRTLVLEMFTNSGCPPCKPANDYFDAWLATYAKKDRVAVIKYHAWWPDPNDPFYLANITQATDRNTYYANNYVPHVFVDGFVDGEASYTSWPLQIENRLGVTALLTLGISSTVATSGGTVTITVGCPTAAPGGTLVLHTVIVESNISYAGLNGETHHGDVMRQMLTGSSGEEFTITTGESKTFLRPVTWNSNWVLANSEIVAFVQVKSSKEIIQGARVAAAGTVSAVAHDAELPTTPILHQNYPNPFNPGTEIEFAIPHATMVSLKIFDEGGREIATLIEGFREAGNHAVTWNPVGLSSGVYFYRLQSDGFVQTRKLILLK